ncbi:tail fiber assembly protein [Aeromonas enteropelogenes]|uniref:tail fiber assembly protein n=1 Tax=Aeromonas enteropelogenes TaxID=29489 RepID=UPI003F748F32
MTRLSYDDNGFAIESGFESCHCCDYATGAYIGLQDQYVSIHCGLPAHAYLEAPPEWKDGEWPARLSSSEPWVILPDFRGKIAYHIETKQPREIKELGSLPAHETLLKPASIHDKWDGEHWQADDEAEADAALAAATVTRSALLAEANQHIAVLGDAVDLGMATDAELDAYNAWRRYRVELTRLDLTLTPIVWPEKPQ